MAEQEAPAGGSQDAAASQNQSVPRAATVDAVTAGSAPSSSAPGAVGAGPAAALDAASDLMAGATDDAAGSELENQSAIDDLLRQATQVRSDDTSDSTGGGGPTANVTPIDLPTFTAGMGGGVSNIDLLRDVDLNVKIELGRSRMLVEDVLKLSEGSVVELDKPAGDPVDIFVNDRLVARGEVLVLNDNFCVRVNEIIAVAREESA